MSQPNQPWQQPAQPAFPAYGQPPPQPQQPPQAGPGYGYAQHPQHPQQYAPPFARPQPSGGDAIRVLLALALTGVATVVLIVGYGFLTGAVTDLDGQLKDAAEIEIAQLTWLAAGIGALIALPSGMLAPGKPIFVAAAPLALAAMLLGETFATAVVYCDFYPSENPFAMFFEHFSSMWENWTKTAHLLTWLLLPLAPAAALFTGFWLGRGARRRPRPLAAPQPGALPPRPPGPPGPGGPAPWPVR